MSPKWPRNEKPEYCDNQKITVKHENIYQFVSICYREAFQQQLDFPQKVTTLQDVKK